MAIPDWVWSAGSGSETQRSDEPLNGAAIERATSEFELLSNTTRLKILTALRLHSEPLSYTELRKMTETRDKGKFNYHLRQLDGFICSTDGTYTLTERGDALVASLPLEASTHRQD